MKHESSCSGDAAGNLALSAFRVGSVAGAGSRAVCIESNDANLGVGQRNAAIDDWTGRMTFKRRCIGGKRDRGRHRGKTTGAAEVIDCFDFDAVWARGGEQFIEVLQLDAQDAEQDSPFPIRAREAAHDCVSQSSRPITARCPVVPITTERASVSCVGTVRKSTEDRLFA